ncbi:hypothetical protein [Streptomyces sp. NPDC003015]
MTGGLRWVPEAYPFGYSLVFCEHLAPEQVLVRLGARREALYPLTRHETQEIEVRNSMDEPFSLDHLEDLDVEVVEELGFLRRTVDAVVRAGEIEGWAFAIQASTSYVSAVNYLPRSPRAAVSSPPAVTSTPRSGWSTRSTGGSCPPSTPGFPRTTTARTRRSSPGRWTAGV